MDSGDKRVADLERLVLNLQAALSQAQGQLTHAVSERERDEAHRQELVAIVEASRDAIWSWTPNGTIATWNAEAERLLGYRADEIIGQSLFTLVPSERMDRARAAIAKVLQGGWFDQYDTVRLRKDGTRLPVELTVSPIRDAAGNIVRIATICRDITARKQDRQALADSEERYRSLVDNANDIVAMLDLDFRFTSVNPAVQRILGYAPEEIIGTPLSQYVPGDQLAMHRDMLARKLEGAAATRYEMQLLGKNRQRFTLEVNSRLLSNDGKPFAIHAIARDISDRKDAEARQVVLIRELQHRTKNMLAVIQSIVTSTLSRSKDLKSAHEALIGRLHALAHAQEFVVDGPGGGAPLREVIEAELRPFAGRAVISGESLVVGGAFAQTFALVIHELATNAVKHGALSAAGGRVLLSWEIDRAIAAPQLSFSWRERGGPPASLPKDTGLGTQLIALLGKSKLAFKADGFEYSLRIPLEEVVWGRE